MLGEVIGAFKLLAARPAVMGAALIVLILQAIVFFLVADFGDAVLLGLEGFGGEIGEFVFAYSGELSAVVLAMVVGIALELFVVFVVGKSVAGYLQNGKAGIGEIVDGVRGVSGLAGAAVFVALVFLLWFLAVLGVLWSFGLDALLGEFLLIVVGVCSIYLFVRLGFFATIMGAKGLDLKRALKESWKFTGKRFWGALAFLIVLWVVVSIIAGVGGLSVLIEHEIVSLLVFVFFAIAGASYWAAGLGYYYLYNGMEIGGKGSGTGKAMSARERVVLRRERKRLKKKA